MTLALVLKHAPAEGSLHRLKVDEAIRAAEGFGDARVLLFGDAQEFATSLPVLHLPLNGGPFETALLLRKELSKGDLIHCLDMEAAFDVLASGVGVDFILDPQALPSVRYQDTTAQIESSVLAHLIEREEQVIRRCCAVIYANMFTRRLLGLRGVQDHQLRLRKETIVKPRTHPTQQSLVQVIYQHERLKDARVVYEAFQRLNLPCRISVMVRDEQARNFWLRDRRMRVIEHDKDWKAHLECSMIAVCGGATSVGAASGLEIPRLALWGAHFGVTVIGTENSLWRMLMPGTGLVPCDRPDLLVESLRDAIRNADVRQGQHGRVVEYYERNVQAIDTNFLPDLWRELES